MTRVSAILFTAALTLGAASVVDHAILRAQQATSTSPAIMKMPLSTIAGLPACNAGAEGLVYGVADALLPVALATIASGGLVHVIAYCNGSIWIVL